MYKKTDFSVKISGTIGGTIWWPHTRGAWKRFDYTCQDNDTLRDAVLRITNDGDFESCDIIDGVISVTLIKSNRRTTRYFDLSLSLFPSIQDCIDSTLAWPDLE